MLALSMRCASHAATFSKSLVCLAFGRVHGLLGAHAAAGAAVDAVYVSVQPHLAGTEVQVPPPPSRGVVAGRCRCPAGAHEAPSTPP